MNNVIFIYVLCSLKITSQFPISALQVSDISHVRYEKFMRSHKFKPKEIIDYAWTRVDYFELRVIKIFTPGEDLDLECGVDRGDLDGGRVDLLPDPLWTFDDLTLYANSTGIKPTLHQVKPSQKKYLILDN